MSRIIRILTVATLTLGAISLGESALQAKAGATCSKVGALKTFGGVTYTCQTKKKKKIWVATTTVIPITTASWDCGPTFSNTQFPAFALDRLLLKPASQSVFTYQETQKCQVSIEWTPGSNAATNRQRNVSVCWDNWYDWPDANTVEIECSRGYDMPANGRLTLNWWINHKENVPLFGFYMFYVNGYLGESTTAEWKSPRHLVMYNINTGNMPEDFSYYRVNGVRT
jgi:hypothetical protein